MAPIVRHAARTIVYLACVGIGATLGRGAAEGLLAFLPVPAGVFFLIICVVAALLFGCVAPLEQHLWWRRGLTSNDADLKWIGRSSGSLLTGSIDSPVSLGLLLGLVSLLKG